MLDWPYCANISSAIKADVIHFCYIYVSNRFANFLQKKQQGIFPFYELYPGLYNQGAFFRAHSINIREAVILMVNHKKGL